MANLGSSRSHRSNPLSRFLLVLSTYAPPSFTLTHSLSLSSSFISAVIGPLPNSSLWHNITQNSLFKYSCKKSFHPLHRPNSDNRLLPLSPSIAPCFASPLDCLATHQKDAIYQPHSCQRRLLRSLSDLEEDSIVMRHRIVFPFILVLECVPTPLYFDMVSHGRVRVCRSQWLRVLFRIYVFESLYHPTILLFHSIISTWFRIL